MNRKHKFLGVYNQLWVILLWFTLMSFMTGFIMIPRHRMLSVLLQSPCYTRESVYYFTNWSAQTERKGVFWLKPTHTCLLNKNVVSNIAQRVLHTNNCSEIAPMKNRRCFWYLEAWYIFHELSLACTKGSMPNY